MPSSCEDDVQTPNSSPRSSPGAQVSFPVTTSAGARRESSATMCPAGICAARPSSNASAPAGSDPEDEYWVHESRLMAYPDFDPDSSDKLINASKCLYIHPSMRADAMQSWFENSECGCLIGHASRLGTEGCSAAIAFYQQHHRSEIQAGDPWIDAQLLILEAIAAAQWSAYDTMRAKTGPVFDQLKNYDERLPCSEYDEGHVQPWMTAKITRAIRDAVRTTFAKVDTLMEVNPSDYQAFSCDGLGTAYNRVDRAAFPCLCKAHSVGCIAEGAIVNDAHY